MKNEDLSSDTLDALLLGLVIACPYDNSNPEDCPLNSLRKEPLKERLKEISTWSMEKKTEVYQNHRRCLEDKEKP